MLQLNEPADHLCDLYLGTAQKKLDESLAVLDKQVKLAGGQELTGDRPSDVFESTMDILEFVDHGCNSFISDLCLVIAAYNETFLLPQKKDQSPQEPLGRLGHHQSNLSSVMVDEKMANEKLTAFVNRLINIFFEHLRYIFINTSRTYVKGAPSYAATYMS